MVEIIEVRDSDLEYLAANLRECDLREIRAANGPLVDPLFTLKGSVLASDEAFVGLVDGVPFCVFGVYRNPRQPWMGIVWMLGTKDFSRRSVMRQISMLSSYYIEGWLQEYDVLMNFVAVENDVAVKWLRRVGFEIGDPVVHGVDKSLFYPFCITRSLKGLEPLDTEERLNLCSSE